MAGKTIERYLNLYPTIRPYFVKLCIASYGAASLVDLRRCSAKLTTEWPGSLGPQTKLVDWLLHFREGLFLLAICVVGGVNCDEPRSFVPNFEKPHPEVMRLDYAIVPIGLQLRSRTHVAEIAGD